MAVCSSELKSTVSGGPHSTEITQLPQASPRTTQRLQSIRIVPMNTSKRGPLTICRAALPCGHQASERCDQKIDIGSVICPLTQVLKCRWHPVEYPVVPTAPIT